MVVFDIARVRSIEKSAEIFLAGILRKLCSTFSIKLDIARFLQCQL